MQKSFLDLLKQPLQGKVVLVRVDFNVPISDGKVVDDTRIRASLPTIQQLISKQARVVLISHFQRPKGQVVESLRLDPIRDRLQELLGATVTKLDECIGERVESEISSMNDSEVLLLENIRFYKEEESNDDLFSKTIASYGHYYVQDAFGTVHRKHASTFGVAQYLPSYPGQLLDDELNALGIIINNPKRPLMAIIGGSKISTKFTVLNNLIDKVDIMVLGGAMVYTLLQAQGSSVGKSLVEPDLVSQANVFLDRVQSLDKVLYIPEDHQVVRSFDDPSSIRTIASDEFEDLDIGVDIGPKSIVAIGEFIAKSAAIFWNGPVGIFETPEYATGTFSIAKYLSESLNSTTIVGGGDSISALNLSGYSDNINHISTGGGASLEFLEGKELPGIAVLS